MTMIKFRYRSGCSYENGVAFWGDNFVSQTLLEGKEISPTVQTLVDYENPYSSVKNGWIDRFRAAYIYTCWRIKSTPLIWLVCWFWTFGLIDRHIHQMPQVAIGFCVIAMIAIFGYSISFFLLGFMGACERHRYHSAEHMTANYVESESPSFPLDIEEVRKQSWFTLGCGRIRDIVATILFVLFLIIKVPIPIAVTIALFASSLVAEDLRNKDHPVPVAFRKIFFYPLRLFCFKPSKKHLEVAITAMNNLLKAEADFASQALQE